MTRMGISEIYANAGAPILSYEFFPPKTDAGYRSLFRTIEDLKKLSPGFVSVTMGAGGTTREKTVDLTIEIAKEIGLVSMFHLPCTPQHCMYVQPCSTHMRNHSAHCQ